MTLPTKVALIMFAASIFAALISNERIVHIVAMMLFAISAPFLLMQLLAWIVL